MRAKIALMDKAAKERFSIDTCNCYFIKNLLRENIPLSRPRGLSPKNSGSEMYSRRWE